MYTDTTILEARMITSRYAVVHRIRGYYNTFIRPHVRARYEHGKGSILAIHTYLTYAVRYRYGTQLMQHTVLRVSITILSVLMAVVLHDTFSLLLTATHCYSHN